MKNFALVLLIGVELFAIAALAGAFNATAPTARETTAPISTVSPVAIPTATPKPAFAVSALDAIQAVDELCFSDWFEEGEDPHLMEHCADVGGDYICTPVSGVTLSFYTNDDGKLRSVDFDYNRTNTRSGTLIEASYFSSYAEYFLVSLYGDDEGYRLSDELKIWSSPLAFTFSNSAKHDNDKWTFANVSESGHLRFHGSASA